MKRITTLLGVLALALTFGAGQAVADDGAGAAQTAGQSAPSGQMADGSGSAYQGGASNSASSIRVLSPGNDGGVTQSNSTTAAAIAANANKTNQDTTQSQTGGAPGSDYTQIAGQEAKNKQDADADAKAVQIAPSNDGQSIRVLSPGNSGDLTQSNSATAGAAALNGNKTDQSIDQSQTGGTQPSYADGKKPDEKSGYGSDYTQVAGQEASNDQDADADATAVQVKPSNTASSIRVLSPGDDGDVSQSNDATALGIAANGNKTDQSTEQSQGGAPAPSDARKPDEKSGYGSDYTQIAGQDASNKQDADADATAVQLKPSNTASSIRVLSPGDDGDVSQSNSTTAVAAALNGNKTDQSIDQSQSGSGSDYTQVAGQEASNKQDADADATAVQLKPSNTASSIRVLSPGDGGDVSQSNSTTAVAAALNGNKTDQSIDQSQTGGYADAEEARRQVGSRLELHADRGPGRFEQAGRRRGCDGRPAEAVQLGIVDPRAQPGRRRGRLAVERRDRHRHRGEPQQDGPVDRPGAVGRRPGLRLHPGRRAGRFEQAGRRRGCDGRPGEAVQRCVVDPRPQQGRRR